MLNKKINKNIAIVMSSIMIALPITNTASAMERTLKTQHKVVVFKIAKSLHGQNNTNNRHNGKHHRQNQAKGFFCNGSYCSKQRIYNSSALIGQPVLQIIKQTVPIYSSQKLTKG